MNYRLTNENIEKSIEEIQAYLRDKGIDRKETLKATLLVEESLLCYKDEFGENIFFTTSLKKNLLGRIRIAIMVRSPLYDPFRKDSREEASEENQADNESSEFDDISLTNYFDGSILENRKWTFSHGCNIVAIDINNKEISQWKLILAAIGAAVILGFTAGFLPAGVSGVLSGTVIPAFTTIFTGVLAAVSGPLIFVSMTCGIISIGDVSMLGVIGKRFSKRFALNLILYCCFACLVFSFFFRIPVSFIAEVSGMQPLVDTLVGIFPDNIFKAFFDNNSLQMLLISIVLAIAILKTPGESDVFEKLLQRLEKILCYVMALVTAFCPLFIFFNILDLMIKNEFTSFFRFLLPFSICILIFVLILAAETAMVCLKLRITPFILWKKVFAPVLIALTTASSVPSIPDNLSCCKEQFGIKPYIANFGIMFAQTVYKPGTAITLLIFTVYAMCINGISISVFSFAVVIITLILFSIASPPVTGGTFAIYSIIFSQFNIPLTDLGFIITAVAFLDYPLTATNVASRAFGTILEAESLGMMDKTKVREDSEKS